MKAKYKVCSRSTWKASHWNQLSTYQFVTLIEQIPHSHLILLFFIIIESNFIINSSIFLLLFLSSINFLYTWVYFSHCCWCFFTLLSSLLYNGVLFKCLFFYIVIKMNFIMHKLLETSSCLFKMRKKICLKLIEFSVQIWI